MESHSPRHWDCLERIDLGFGIGGYGAALGPCRGMGQHTRIWDGRAQKCQHQKDFGKVTAWGREQGIARRLSPAGNFIRRDKNSSIKSFISSIGALQSRQSSGNIHHPWESIPCKYSKYSALPWELPWSVVLGPLEDLQEGLGIFGLQKMGSISPQGRGGMSLGPWAGLGWEGI